MTRLTVCTSSMTRPLPESSRSLSVLLWEAYSSVSVSTELGWRTRTMGRFYRKSSNLHRTTNWTNLIVRIFCRAFIIYQLLGQSFHPAWMVFLLLLIIIQVVLFALAAFSVRFGGRTSDFCWRCRGQKICPEGQTAEC